MINKYFAKSVNVLLLCFVMCFSLFNVGTAAFSPDKNGSISIACLDRETKEPVSGAVFRLYFIADTFEETGRLSYKYAEDFKNSGIDLGDFSDAYLPVHLMAYAMLNNISYTEKTSASNSCAVFSDLHPGAYLVVTTSTPEGYLRPSPFIALVPMYDSITNQWVYDIDASPKVEADMGSEDEKTYISVKKQWEGTAKHPDSIEVTLLKDGVIMQTVILSAENNWYHRWDDLDKNHSWNVVESEVPQGYAVSYSISQMTVIITNSDSTVQEETTIQPDETTTDSDITNTDETTTDSGDGNTTTKPTDTAENENTTKPEELIHTGQLNWPVPVFSVAGLILFSIGWAMLNIGKKEET